MSSGSAKNFNHSAALIKSNTNQKSFNQYFFSTKAPLWNAVSRIIFKAGRNIYRLPHALAESRRASRSRLENVARTISCAIMAKIFPSFEGCTREASSEPRPKQLMGNTMKAPREKIVIVIHFVRSSWPEDRDCSISVIDFVTSWSELVDALVWGLLQLKKQQNIREA